MEKAEVFSVLLSYKDKIEQGLRKKIDSFGKKTKLRDACEYVLLNGGKRFRPALVLLIAEAVGKGIDVTEAALSIELFHTASLIADDLPCMDNDDMRRSKPSVHKVYGEAVALLASYALIAAGYECISKNSQILKSQNDIRADEICMLALENVSQNTGFLGATGGQFLDLYPPDLSRETLYEVIQKKTNSLFEVAFVLGWLFGGGETGKLSLVKRAAQHFGSAFQLADDLGDLEQDAKTGRKANFAAVLGLDEAKRMFRAEIEEYDKTLTNLGLGTSELRGLGHLLKGV